MQNHHSLRVYQASERLARQVYALTPALPPHERYNLVDQLQRAALSIGSNIVEGCGRSTPRDFCCFLDKALGSAKEVAFQLKHARSVYPMPASATQAAIGTSIVVQRMLTRLIARVRPRDAPPRSAEHE